MKKILLILLFVSMIFGLTEFLMHSEMSLLAQVLCFAVGISIIWLGFRISPSAED